MREDGYDVLRLMGITVQVYEGLAAEMLYSPTDQLVVVRAGLSPDVRERLVCQMLGRVRTPQPEW